MTWEGPLLVDALKVLADESRIRILGVLAGGEARVEELAEALGLRPPTVSHHLSRLKAAGFVSMEKRGTTHLYQFQPDAVRSLNRELDPDRLRTLAPTPAEGGDPFSAKVLRDFFVGDTLKEIPASRKKRLIVLRWLAERFEPGRRYREREVNDVILRHHPDFATIRREFIINRLMDREGGVYWRIEKSESSLNPA